MKSTILLLSLCAALSCTKSPFKSSDRTTANSLVGTRWTCQIDTVFHFQFTASDIVCTNTRDEPHIFNMSYSRTSDTTLYLPPTSLHPATVVTIRESPTVLIYHDLVFYRD